MESSRQRWTQERRRKQPSLYDEYLNQEKAQQTSQFSPPSRIVAPSLSEPTTIRTVTPENSGNTSEGTAAVSTGTSSRSYDLDRDRDRFPQNTPSSSPRNKLQKEKATPRTLTLNKTALARSESTDASKRENIARLAYASRRTRTRTLDEIDTREEPPGQNRLRHPALVLAGPSHSHSASESVASIGHPQVVSPLSQKSFSSNSSTVPPHRPLSPVSTLASNTENTDSTGGPMTNANARRILHLMKTLCGRMSGSLAFRRGANSPWVPAHCYIQEETGSLMCEPDMNASHHRTLVPDLRGCQVKTAMEEDAQIPYLDLSLPNSSLELHIRLKDRNDFDSWFAALLCWQPIRPKGIQNKMAKPQSPIAASFPLTDSRRNSEMSLTLKEAPIIKVGPMIYWDSNVSYTNTSATRSIVRPHAARMQSYGLQWWRRVSCTLRENGEMKLYAESGSTLLSVVQLSHLSRCAIQRLDPSVLDNEFCIAIYPQYTSGAVSSNAVRPIYLSLDSRTLYEVWFVLLRAFTIPQLYGPKPPVSDDHDESTSPQVFDNLLATNATDMFRMERALLVRIVEARLPHTNNSLEVNFHHSTRHQAQAHKAEPQDGYYIEIQLDEETRAKTQVKHEGSSPFWREEFEYLDLPAVLTSASVVLRRRPPDLTTAREQHELRLVHEAYGLNDRGQQSGTSGGFVNSSHDHTLGKVEIYLEELEASKEIEKWWPVVNPQGDNVGEILIKARAEENVILMSRDYEPLNQLLHKFDNELTLQIAQMIPGELRRLSDTLLNIFSVSGQVTDWLMALVEEEIDGIHKETPVSRLRYSSRIGGSNDGDGPVSANSERELIVRDMNKNATLEANLLFRGNTLLTKSLDSHMRRVGKEYLLAVLGPTIREIAERNPDCEVDPNRVGNEQELKKNWSRLLSSTQDVWIAIKSSVKKAPVELRIIFRHIRACAEDRYGDFLRSVSYSSVSGFLFLRFFCPAVLNPKLFGLLKGKSSPFCDMSGSC